MKSNYVFVVDTGRMQQNPVHPAVARKLLRGKQAAILRRQPFTIILKSHGSGPLFVKPLRLKIDPGSKMTGFALLDGHRVIWAAELTYRGQQIKNALESRRALRRGRRNRKTRYRKPRFLNRRRPEGWLAPSLMHRVHTTMTWVSRVCRWAPVQAISMELVRFDTQLMQNPEISGVQYQQGELCGYEVREYLLEKFKRTCSYCGAKDTPLEIEHIVPKSRGGSDRVSNLTLACRPCNKEKDNKTIDEFLAKKPDLAKRIKSHAKGPLKDAAAVNATRWRLWRELNNTGLPLETGTGGRTKYNRTRQRLPKTHYLDAACVGASTPMLSVLVEKPLSIKCTGHGTRQVVRTDKYGFPRGKAGRIKQVQGFRTGDLVRLSQAKGKYAGIWEGILAGIRTTGYHDIKTACSKKITSSWKNYELLQRADGYAYDGINPSGGIAR